MDILFKAVDSDDTMPEEYIKVGESAWYMCEVYARRGTEAANAAPLSDLAINVFCRKVFPEVALPCPST